MPERSFSRARILSALRIGDTDGALAVLGDVYPGHEPLPTTRFFLDQLFASMRRA